MFDKIIENESYNIQILREVVCIMNKKQKDLIDKLNKDNKNLSEVHQSWIEYSQGKILIGVILVVILIVLSILD